MPVELTINSMYFLSVDSLRYVFFLNNSYKNDVKRDTRKYDIWQIEFPKENEPYIFCGRFSNYILPTCDIVLFRRAGTYCYVALYECDEYSHHIEDFVTPVVTEKDLFVGV